MIQVITGAALALAVAVLAVVVIAQGRRIRSLDAELARETDRAERAPQRSRDVTTGQVLQHLMPLLPGFPYNPRDVQWVGGTVDAIVWDGLEAGDPDITVVLLECKKTRGHLGTRQRKIKRAVAEGRVRFDCYTPVTEAVAPSEPELSALLANAEPWPPPDDTADIADCPSTGLS